MNIKNIEQKIISKSKNNFKIIFSFFIMMIALVVLIVSAIYFSQLTWDTNVVKDYWLRYMWLCLIILSSAAFLGSTLILSKYFAKILEYHTANKKKKNKMVDKV